MPTYRIIGVVRFDFQHEIGAASEEEARDAVRQLGLLDLDNYDSGAPEIRHAENISPPPLVQLAEQAE